MLGKANLFNVFEKAYFNEWREEIEERIKNNDDYSLDKIKDILTTLGVHPKTTSIVIASIVDRMDYIHYEIEHRLINMCIKMGMELGEEEGGHHNR